MSLMVTSALAIKENFTTKSQNRVLSYGSDILGNNQVLPWVKFQIRRCIAKHLRFLSRVRLRCHHSQNNVCSKLVTSTLLYKNRQLAIWLKVSPKCQVQTEFQAYSSKKKEIYFVY